MSDWGRYIWFDGKLIPFEDARIHVMTHSLHYGVGVFEGIRAYRTDNGRTAIFRLYEHVDRLLLSANAYKLEIPYTRDEIAEAIIEVVRKSGFDDCYIRPIAFINATKLGVRPPTRRASLAIGVFKWGKYLGEAYYKGARVITSHWRRPPSDSLPMNSKATGHYINSYLATIEAHMKGFDEAILLDSRGFISEGPGQNLFIVKDTKLITPPLHASILPGITRDSIIKLARRELGIGVLEEDITLGMLYSADEAFFTGTATEVTPIVEVDGVPIGDGKPGKVSKRLQKLYEDVVRGRLPEYEEWLTYV
ncbi:MAG: branched-chain amino acid transaminase [Desulfurococcales archaeon]|nr:branched-chain amino acid transaminase [Desulfurococcales archaeon]